jgi:hypothetical protein
MMEPMIKPLVWEPWSFGRHQAKSVFGTYHTWDGHWRPPEGGPGRKVNDPQAAVQADYAARITAALDPAWLAWMEALVTSAEGLAQEARDASALLHNLGMGRPVLDTALTTYRAAKEAANG